MNSKTNKGITLIALVITIIVLLILAGVTISMVLGDDGIIAQAQQAKQAQEDAEEKEQEEIQKGQGNIDLYTTGTVANKVQVGDYVTYTYTEAQYNTDDTADIGSSQKFSSALSTTTDGVKAAKVTAWRVLSKKDGIVKLVAQEPVSTLQLSGADGYLNGPDVLNEMCKALYSSDIGTARSINVDDVNEITKYDGTKFYYDKTYTRVPIPADEKLTIGDLENNGTLGLEKLTARTTPDGRDIAEYEVFLIQYDIDDENYTNKWLTKEKEEYKMLFGEDNVRYWLANSSVRVDFRSRGAEFLILQVYDGNVYTGYFFDSWGYGGSSNCAVRPVVTLKTGLEIDTTVSDTDGKTVESAWHIKAINNKILN